MKCLKGEDTKELWHDSDSYAELMSISVRHPWDEVWPALNTVQAPLQIWYITSGAFPTSSFRSFPSSPLFFLLSSWICGSSVSESLFDVPSVVLMSVIVLVVVPAIPTQRWAMLVVCYSFQYIFTTRSPIVCTVAVIWHVKPLEFCSVSLQPLDICRVPHLHNFSTPWIRRSSLHVQSVLCAEYSFYVFVMDANKCLDIFWDLTHVRCYAGLWHNQFVRGNSAGPRQDWFGWRNYACLWHVAIAGGGRVMSARYLYYKHEPCMAKLCFYKLTLLMIFDIGTFAFLKIWSSQHVI